MTDGTVEGVFFQPWVGETFAGGAVDGVRLLVVGESHYGDVSDVPDLRTLTKVVIRNHIDRPRERLFGRIEQLVGNGPLPDRAARVAFWNRIAFYNFVQEVLPQLGDRPTVKQWSEARSPFLSVLRTLRPQAVLVLGKVMWDSLSVPPLFESRSIDVAGAPYLFRWRITRDYSTIATWANHPSGSRGFKMATWRPHVLALLLAASEAAAER